MYLHDLFSLSLSLSLSSCLFYRFCHDPCFQSSLLVLPYNPENKISVAAVLKLDLYAGIKVLTRLGTQLDNFKERAGFTISYHKPLPMSELYEESSTVKCIKSWVDDETSSIPPTWNNFFQILREPTMNLSDIADDIDRYLESTAQKEQSEQKRDSELCMLNYV